MNRTHHLACTLALTTLTALPSFGHAATYQTDLVRCTHTDYATNGGICGGDNLVSGSINVLNGKLMSGRVSVTVKGALAEPFNLYEVYWLPIGAASVDAIYVGNFATDCNGDAKAAILKTINTPKQALNTGLGVKANLFTAVGSMSAGNFILYSRGPWGDDTNGDCVADTYNTTTNPADTDPSHALANPTINLSSDGVQFISGFQK